MQINVITNEQKVRIRWHGEGKRPIGDLLPVLMNNLYIIAFLKKQKQDYPATFSSILFVPKSIVVKDTYLCEQK